MKGIKKFSGYFLTRAVHHFFKLLPTHIALYCGKFLGRIGYFLLLHQRKKAESNLKKAGYSPEEGRKIIKACFSCTGEKAVQAIHALKILRDPRFKVRLEGEEVLHELKDNGGLIVTAHMGNWELMGAWAVRQGIPLTVIARPLYSPHLSRWIMNERQKLGMETIYTEGITSLSKVLKAIKDRRAVAVLADARPRSESTYSVPFFGRSLELASTPFRISMKAPLSVLALFYRTTNSFTHNLFICKMKGKTPEERARFFAMCLEEKIRVKPEEWIWWLRQL